MLMCSSKTLRVLEVQSEKFAVTNKHVFITPTFRELHWLPIQARINFKICLLMYRIHTNSSHSYDSSLVTSCSSLQSRRALRSSFQADFVVTRSLRKLGNHAFGLAGPPEWNKLPDFIRRSAPLSLFKTYLKM